MSSAQKKFGNYLYKRFETYLFPLCHFRGTQKSQVQKFSVIQWRLRVEDQGSSNPQTKKIRIPFPNPENQQKTSIPHSKRSPEQKASSIGGTRPAIRKNIVKNKGRKIESQKIAGEHIYRARKHGEGDCEEFGKYREWIPLLGIGMRKYVGQIERKHTPERKNKHTLQSVSQNWKRRKNPHKYWEKTMLIEE